MPDAEAPREPLSVYEHLASMADFMAAVAWQKLGLQPDMATGQLSPDLDEAKVAIDVTAYVANLLDARLEEEDRRRMQSLVRDLRMNYVNQRGAA